MIKAEKLPFHYGWLIVFACGMGMFAIFPQVFTVPGNYVVSITEDLGIVRTVYSFSVTLLTLSMAAAASLLSRILKRFSIRWVMILTAVVLGINLMSYSLLTSVAGLYIRAAISGACACLAGNMIMTILLQRWFVKNVNFAMSLAFTCTGLGGMVFSQVLSRVLLSYGWRSCYFVSGVTVMLLVVPVYFFLIRDNPGDVGLQPFGAGSLTDTTAEKPADTGTTLQDAKRHGYFYLFIPALMMVSMAAGCTQGHFPPALADAGYAVLTIATIQSIYSVLNSLTKLSVGIIFDKIGPKIGLFIVIMGYVVGYMSLAFAGLNPALGYLAGIGFGIGIAWSTLGVPFVIASIFGRKDYAAVYGFCSMMTQVASAIASTGAGIVYDVVGNYFPVWMVFSAGSLVSFAIFIFGLNKNFFMKPTVEADGEQVMLFETEAEV